MNSSIRGQAFKPRAARCCPRGTAALLLLFRGIHIFVGPLNDFPWTLKSAIPLIAVGFSYLCFIATAPRTALQRLLGFLVALAFILWGAEQFLPDQILAAGIDDLVVFLFVLDLSLVIRENLTVAVAARSQPTTATKSE
jgi:uncharacterized membrane protein YkvA (DUF1232 family)